MFRLDQRETYYDDGYITVELERMLSDYEDFMLIHCSVHDFNKESLKAIRNGWDGMANYVKNMGYNEIYTYTKDERLPKMIGMNPTNLGSVPDENGNPIHIYEWEL